MHKLLEEAYDISTKNDLELLEDDLDDLLDKLEREGYGVWPYKDSLRGYGFNVYSAKRKLTKDEDVYYFFTVNLNSNKVLKYKTLNPNILDGRLVSEQEFSNVDELDTILHNEIESINPQNTIIDAQIEEDLTDEEQSLLDRIDNFITKLYELRQSSIKEEGEFGTGNLVFKEFRNLGYLDNLKKLKTKLQGKEMSLEGLKEELDDYSDNLLYTTPNYTKEPKEGKLRLYHMTDRDNINSILDNGLDNTKAKPYDNPGKVIWLSSINPLDTYSWNYGNALFEIDLPKDYEDLYKVNDHEYNVYRKIPSEYINAVYLQSPYRKEIMNDFKNTRDFNKSIERFKNGELKEWVDVQNTWNYDYTRKVDIYTTDDEYYFYKLMNRDEYRFCYYGDIIGYVKLNEGIHEDISEYLESNYDVDRDEEFRGLNILKKNISSPSELSEWIDYDNATIYEFENYYLCIVDDEDELFREETFYKDFEKDILKIYHLGTDGIKEGLNESKTFRFPKNLTDKVLDYYKNTYSTLSLQELPIKQLVDDNDLLNDDDLQSYHQRQWNNAKAKDFHIDQDKINNMRPTEVPFVVLDKDEKLKIVDGRHRIRALYNDGYDYVEVPTVVEDLNEKWITHTSEELNESTNTEEYKFFEMLTKITSQLKDSQRLARLYPSLNKEVIDKFNEINNRYDKAQDNASRNEISLEATSLMDEVLNNKEKYLKGLDQGISDSNIDLMLDEMLKLPQHELLDKCGMGDTFDKPELVGPMFILDDGSFVYVSHYISGDITHLDFVKQMIKNYAENVYPNAGVDFHLYSTSENFMYNLLKNGWVRCNTGSSASDRRFYCVLPDKNDFKPTNEQFYSLAYFLDLNDTDRVLVFCGDYESRYYYKEDGSDYIINRIKRYYNDGELRESLLEAKEDQQRFISKFGEDTFNQFNKLKDRIKNLGVSVDLTFHAKNTSVEEMKDILTKASNYYLDKQTGNTDTKDIKGDYEYIGEANGYKVYKVNDYIASFYLGSNTGWCISGRYGHYKDEKNANIDEAEDHFNEYKDQNIQFYFFIGKDKYALALYPKVFNVYKFIDDETYLEATNFELFDEKDEIDYGALSFLPIDLIKDKIVINKYDTLEGLVIKGNTLVKVNENVKGAVIPNGITIIGNGAFSNFSWLESITIPEGVTTVGSYAFSRCSSLRSVEIPNSVTSIGEGAFLWCGSLTSITIPNSVTSIGDGAFRRCDSLTSITISDNVKRIGESAFASCKSLSSITIPKGVTSINDSVFNDCEALTSIVIPKGVKSIGVQAFWGCSSLTAITIPDTVTSIGDFAFEYCDALLTIYTDNEYVKKYGKENKIPCKPLSELKEGLALKESKQDIDNFIAKFGQDTYDLFQKSIQRLKNNKISTDITWHTKNTSKEELDNILHNLQAKVKTNEPADLSKGITGKYNYLGEKDGYKVYQPLDYISSMALGVNTGWCTTGRYGHYGEPNFKPSEKDAKHHFNEYVSEGIKFYYFLDAKTMYGKYALALYPEMLTVEEIEDENYIEETNFELFDAEDLATHKIPKDLPTDLIPEEVKVISKTYENGMIISNKKVLKSAPDIEEIIIPEGVTEIGPQAFAGRKHLTKVHLPSTLTTINDSAFQNCSSLIDINLGEPKNLVYIGINVFNYCSSLKNIELPTSVSDINEWTFRSCNGLESVTIPGNIKVIRPESFIYCKNLKSVNMLNGVVDICALAFAGCESLVEVKLPNTLNHLGSNAFSGCINLTNIVLPNSLKEVSGGAFQDCRSLVEITIPGSVWMISSGVFVNCSNLKRVVIENGVKMLIAGAFTHCDKLEKLVIPNSVTRIDAKMLYQCGNVVIYTDNKLAIEYGKENKIPCKPLSELKEGLVLKESKQDKENFKKWITQKVEDKYAGMPSGNKEAFINNWVNNFEEDKSALKPPLNDYYYWIKKDDFDAFTAQMFHLNIDKENKQKAKEGAQLIYNKDGWQVYKITNYQASAKYGKGTRWCISGSKRWSNDGSGEKYWNEYSKAGVVFYFFINGNRKYALAIYPDNTTYEIFDDGDNSLGYIPNAPIIEEIPVDYTSKNDYREFYNAVASAKLPDWQYIYGRVYSELTSGEEDDIEILDKDTFLDYVDSSLIPDGYIEHDACENGLITPEEYKNLTGDEYDEEWSGDLMFNAIWDLIDMNNVTTKDEAFECIAKSLKDAKYVIYNIYSGDVESFDSYEDLLVNIIQTCYVWENYKDGFDQFVDSCINITRLLIKQGEENIDDFIKLGISKEFLEKEE